MDVSVLDGFDDVTAPMDTPGADAPSSIDASLDASPDVALDASMDASTDALPSTCGASGQPCCDGATACAFGLACIAGVCGCRDEGMSCSDHAPCCRGPELTKGFSTARCELGVCVSEVISPCTGCMPAACRDIGQSCDSVRNQCCFYSGGRRLTCGTVGGATQCCMPAGYSGCRVRGTDCCVGAVCHESGRCCKPLTQACDSVGECCPTTGVTCSGNRCCLQDGAATSAPSQCCSGRIDGSNRCTSCIGNSTAACIGAPGTTGNCCGAMTCGTRTRPNQRCCMPERGGCGPANPSVQCCDGLMCNGLRCVPACSSTPTTACGTNAPCCSTLACETQSGTGTACCIPNRSTLATCRTSNDCCTRSQGSVCDTRIGSPTQNRCCRTTITGRCTSQAECCGGLNCENVTGLGVRCCLPPAARCETVRSDDQCCGDMVCDDTFSSSSYGTCCMAQGNSCRNGGPACCDRMQCGTEFGTATYNKCCRPLGQACTPRVAGVCCGRAVCDERTVVPTYARCCKPTGVSCVLSSECCAGATCAGSACCVPYGLACTSNGQCCGGRTCVSGHCA